MINKLSKIYWPLSTIPKDAIVKSHDITSKSQKLLLELGLIKPTGCGTFHILPIAQKALDRCIKLVDCNISKINAQKITLPILTRETLWKKSGRLTDDGGELFIVKDKQNRNHIISPTHEEAVTDLIAMSSPISYKQLPLRLYQIGPKFRDELKPRFGLMRTKEFIMKDLYTFDQGIEEAESTYEEVNQMYAKIFNMLEIPWVKVNGCTGSIGGLKSHEYHIQSTVGEDNIVQCKKCEFASNKELCGEITTCPNCNSIELISSKGIEIGHTFLLKDKYSKPLGATFLKCNGKPDNLIMGCYGIGITRLLAASLEALSSDDCLKWPKLLSPFDLCIIPPKQGSKEEIMAKHYLNEIILETSNKLGEDLVLVDDRVNLTIGRRHLDAKKLGIPLIIVLGSKVMDAKPKFEIFYTKGNVSKFLEFHELLTEISNLSSNIQLVNSYSKQEAVI